jgi:hypothetical protein
MFRALLAHLQEALHKQQLVYCMRVMSVGCYMQRMLIHNKLNTKSASCWFYYTDHVVSDFLGSLRGGLDRTLPPTYQTEIRFVKFNYPSCLKHTACMPPVHITCPFHWSFRITGCAQTVMCNGPQASVRAQGSMTNIRRLLVLEGAKSTFVEWKSEN